MKRPAINYFPPVDPIQGTVEKKSETMVTLPDGNAVYVIGSKEAGVIRVKGISFCKGIKGQGGR